MGWVGGAGRVIGGSFLKGEKEKYFIPSVNTTALSFTCTSRKELEG